MRILLAMTLAAAGVLASVSVMANTGANSSAPAPGKAPAATAGKASAPTRIAAAPAEPTAPAVEAPAAAAAPAAAVPATEVRAAPGAPGAAATVAEPVKPKPTPPVIVANINLATQKMTVTVNGKLQHTWSVSSGLPAYPTPRGSFTATWISKMHYSKQYDDAPMPHSVFFKNGAAIHGTYSTGALGRPASHGCVRLAPGNAATFFNLVSRHGVTRTRVVVHGNPPAPRVASRSRSRDSDSWFNDTTSSRRQDRRARDGYRYPGDSYAWSGSNRGPSWARY